MTTQELADMCAASMAKGVDHVYLDFPDRKPPRGERKT